MIIKDDTFNLFKAAVEAEWPSPPSKRQLAPCEDKCVGVICRENGELYKFDSATAFKYQGIPTQRTITRLLLILESPHGREYCHPNGPVPANGTTGSNIRRYLGEVLESGRKLTDSKLEVILVNAVPYQCSQGAELTDDKKRAKRDQVFRATFCAGGEIPGLEFVRRLSRYVRASDIVVNCCTKGVTSPALRDLVHDSLMRLGEKNLIHLSTSHPVSWFNPSHRKFR